MGSRRAAHLENVCLRLSQAHRLRAPLPGRLLGVFIRVSRRFCEPSTSYNSSSPGSLWQ